MIPQNSIILLLAMLTVQCAGAREPDAPNKHEQRITVILDTLDNDYYHQVVVEDLMGMIPPPRWQQKYPFRIALDEYREELHALLGENLSAPFLISLLNNDNHRKFQRYFYDVINKVAAIRSADSYNALFEYYCVAGEPYYRNHVADILIKHSGYKARVREHILAGSDVEMIDRYIGKFDGATDTAILNKLARYMRDNLKDNPLAAAYKVRVFSSFYGKNFEENFDDYVGRKSSGGSFERARERYWRQCARNALDYHEQHRR